jgi:SRSO17 transposase
MIARALDGGVPCTWVLGDEIYGSDRRLRMFLEQRETPFVLAVRGNEKLWSILDGSLGQHAAAALAAAMPAKDWHRLSAGAVAKGERLYDWARMRLVRLQEPPWDHWLLVRRNRKNLEDLAFYVVFGPAKTPLAMLARVAGRRWIIEECFEAAKQETGLDEYEIRSWHGWHRHVTLSMLALAFLAALRAKCKDQKGPRPTLRATFRAGAAQRAGVAPPSRAHPPSPSPTRSRHDLRLVILETRPPSPRQTLPLETSHEGNATVVLGPVDLQD